MLRKKNCVGSRTKQKMSRGCLEGSSKRHWDQSMRKEKNPKFRDLAKQIRTKLPVSRASIRGKDETCFGCVEVEISINYPWGNGA